MNKEIELLYKTIEAKDKIINEQALEIARLKEQIKILNDFGDKVFERIDKAIKKVKDISFTLSGDKFYTKVILKDTESGKELLEILGNKE